MDVKIYSWTETRPDVAYVTALAYAEIEEENRKLRITLRDQIESNCAKARARANHKPSWFKKLLAFRGPCKVTGDASDFEDPQAQLELRMRRHAINTRFLMAITDRIHELLCPDQLGTWQQRAEQAEKACIAMKQELEALKEIRQCKR